MKNMIKLALNKNYGVVMAKRRRNGKVYFI